MQPPDWNSVPPEYRKAFASEAMRLTGMRLASLDRKTSVQQGQATAILALAVAGAFASLAAAALPERRWAALAALAAFAHAVLMAGSALLQVADLAPDPVRDRSIDLRLSEHRALDMNWAIAWNLELAIEEEFRRYRNRANFLRGALMSFALSPFAFIIGDLVSPR
jgi:hypothetical protein